MLKTLSAYGFCIAILQLLIACGPATETQTAPEKNQAQNQEAANSEPAKEAKTLILAFGDSLYAGYGLAPDEGFVPDLQKALNDAGQDV